MEKSLSQGCIKIYIFLLHLEKTGGLKSNFSSVPWKRGVYTMDPTQQTFNLQGADSL